MSNTSVAVLLCRYADLATETPRSRSFYTEYFTPEGGGSGGAVDYWRDTTYGHMNMAGSTVFDWLDLSQTSAQANALVYPAGRETVWQWGVDAANAAGIDLSPFAVVIVIVNAGSDHGAVGVGRIIFVDAGDRWEPTFVEHEMGHGFGLGHSWSANPDQVYGDRWDIMSAMNVWMFQGAYPSPTGTGPGLNVPNLRSLGALIASRTWRPTVGTALATVSLAPLNAEESPGFLAAVIEPPALGRHQDRTFSVEYRRPEGWDSGIPAEVVLVHEVRADGISYLLSPQLVLGGASFQTADGRLKITVVSTERQPASASVQIEIAAEIDPPRCAEIRTDIGGLRTEIHELQDELKTASPQEKAGIAAQIRTAQQHVTDLEQEAASLGCGAVG